MAPDVFSSFFGHCLELRGQAGQTVTALSKSMYFKGNSACLAKCHFIWVLEWPFFLCTQSDVLLKGQQLKLVAKLGHYLSDCQEMSVSCNEIKTAKTALGCCRQTQISFHISRFHKCLFIIIGTAFHCLSHIVHLFRKAQLSAQRVNSQRAAVPQSIMVFSCFRPDGVSIGLSSGCRPCMQLPLTRSISLPRINGTFPYPLFTGQ